MRWTELCVLVCVQISLLTCGTESQCDSNNDTIPEVCRQQSDSNVSCEEFSGECLECTWPEDCVYGQTVIVTCVSKYDGIDCVGEQVCVFNQANQTAQKSHVQL